MPRRAPSTGHWSGMAQTGRYIASWIIGVLVAAVVIGAGLYLGLNAMSSSTAITAPTPAAAPAPQPAIAPTAPVEETELPTASADPDVVEDTGQTPVVYDSETATMQPVAPDDVEAQQPAPVDADLDAPAQTAIAPRAPTLGGVAAARLPTGEEILIPAGERVDDYLRKVAKERGIELPADLAEPDEPNATPVVVEARTDDELSEQDMIELQLLEQSDFNDPDADLPDDIPIPRVPD